MTQYRKLYSEPELVLPAFECGYAIDMFLRLTTELGLQAVGEALVPDFVLYNIGFRLRRRLGANNVREGRHMRCLGGYMNIVEKCF